MQSKLHTEKGILVDPEIINPFPCNYSLLSNVTQLDSNSYFTAQQLNSNDFR